ncbi:MAG: hypothetical protein M0036_18580 [Desulfobacteraceae bacterium]|nr:hypothetical protein [Desulfobacteraceae bacterium]
MKISNFPWPRLLSLLAAFYFLSVLLNLDYPTHQFLSAWLLLPSPDVWLLFGILALAAYGGKRTLAWTGWTLTALYLVLRAFRLGDVAVPMYLNRPFNLYVDSTYLLSIYDLLKTGSRQKDFLLMAAMVPVFVVGVIAASLYAWRLAARALGDFRVRSVFLGGSGLLLAMAVLWGWSVRPSAVIRLGQELSRVPRQIEEERAFALRLKEVEKQRAALPSTLKGLAGADVLLFFVESYGRTVFTNPQYRPAMTAILDRFAQTLNQHGFLAVSNYLVSPTFGGISRLAHATLESGVRVSNDLEDAALLRSSLPPLAAYFRANGYRTVSVMPGTRFAFPQGAYFDYDQAYYAEQFDYRGPTFGWAPMPDQFVLDWVRRREFTVREKPLFVRYVLISSHAAFNFQPPFIPDWERIGDGHIYLDQPPIYFPIEWPNLENAGEAYLHSLDYEFKSLGDYLAKFVSADALIIILGDHQPNPQLTEENEPWSVPVHVISPNPRLLEPFRKRGYTPGLIPDQPLPHAGMERFMPDFLQDFR